MGGVMNDPRLDRLAQILVRYSTAVKPHNLVGLSGYPFSPEALPLMHAVLREILRAGGYPIPYLQVPYSEGFDHIFYQEANDDQLKFREPWSEHMIRSLDCDIAIMAPTNTRRLSKADSTRIALFASSRADLLTLYLKRAAEGALRWVISSTPTCAYAQDADMGLPDYEDFLFAATWADQDDPVSMWSSFSNEQSALVAKVSGKSSVVVQGPYVDVSFSILDRKFINCDGRFNMPDGEIFTGPVEDSANGWIESTFPAIYRGVDVGKVRLVLEDGKVVQADAEKNQAFLSSMLDSDEGARRLGEFGVGTNQRISTFSRNMLFDEKIAGTIHFALGAGYPEAGSINESGIHWDFLCDMREAGTITFDGKPVYEDGKFIL